ncbi:three-helix bundle dimerization domain-containing protein [Mycolicibacterium pallens]|uniref:Uncharacterized protein n=1 Tax=Mycolicibacterium pallens TaxID=370524 RepID=A0ABX8V9N9_9MYCO|nr:hypothetical protein [Mycolicibacterium pallens]APE14978.1 hypothetical protein BOH72_06875 [Mycobacterium sp. WY10]QYL14505.1 hypothetical protein K0O64_14880 [Mycolicibacterium pallens]
MRKLSEDVVMHEVEARLIQQYPTVPAPDVVAAVAEARKSFANSTVRDFVPVLIERRVRRLLNERSHGVLLAS